MDTLRDFDELTRKTRRREFEDGLPDLLVGAVIMTLGVLGWYIFSGRGLRMLAVYWIQEPEITMIAILGLLAGMVALLFGSRRLIARLRAAEFWPQKGMIRGLAWQVPQRVSIIAGAIVLIMIAGSFWLFGRGMISQGMMLRAMVSSLSLGTGATYIGIGVDLRLGRYIIVGIAGAILSAWLLLVQIPFPVMWLWLGVGWMVLLACSAAWGLLRTPSSSRQS